MDAQQVMDQYAEFEIPAQARQGRRFRFPNGLGHLTPTSLERHLAGVKALPARESVR